MPADPLKEVVAEGPDHRHARGKRDPLSGLLLLAGTATLCGYRSYSAMAGWAENYGETLRARLGFGRFTRPCRVPRPYRRSSKGSKSTPWRNGSERGRSVSSPRRAGRRGSARTGQRQ